MDFQFDPVAVKSGFDALKSAIETVKSLWNLYPSKPDERANIDEQIKVAEKEVALAEAQIAQALGYKLCRAHFPPIPMLKDRVHPTYVKEIAKCPQCGAEDPAPEYFAQQERIDRKIRDHNDRAAQTRWR